MTKRFNKLWGAATAAVVVAAIALIGIGILVYRIYWFGLESRPAAPAQLSQQQVALLEMMKSLLQLAIVSVVGSAITVILRAREERNEKRRQVQDFRHSILEQLGIIYREVKKSRRILRAAGLTTKFSSPPVAFDGRQKKLYQYHLELVNDRQLELEKLCDLLKNTPSAFRSKARAKLTDCFDCMEDYLGRLVSEYEESWISISTGNPSRTLVDLSCLVDLTGPYKGSRFSSSFCKKFARASFLIRKELIDESAT